MTSEVLRSVGLAMSRFGIPDGNRPLVRDICTHIGVTHFKLTTGYIRAFRVDGGPDLCIGHGWTNGFLSEQEAVASTETWGVQVWESPQRKPLLGVSHPFNGSRW